MTPKIFFIFILTFSFLFSFQIFPSLSQSITSGDPPSFEPGVRIKDGNGDIGAGTMVMYSAPHVVDWNDDGNKDLLIGIFLGGNVLLYLNEGTNNSPAFTTSSKIQADGNDLSVRFD